MKRTLYFFTAFVLLLKTSTLSAQIVSGYNSMNSSSSIGIKLDALPLCSEDFENYHYNHFLPPEGYRDIIETRTLSYFSLYEHKGKIKSLQVNTYGFQEEFGEKRKVLKAYNKAEFDEDGRIINLDYKPEFNGGYHSYDVFKVIGDGNLNLFEVEYNDEGKVGRRYLTANKRAYMDYTYDDKGRVVKITFDIGYDQQDGSNITTVKYTYDTRQGHENYITFVESFVGTKKQGEATLSYATDDLRLKQVVVEDKMNVRTQTWEYKYNGEGDFSIIDRTRPEYSDFKIIDTERFDFEWGNKGGRRCHNVSTRLYTKNNHKTEDEHDYIFTFDEHGNWIQLESDYCIYERIFEYVDETTDSVVSDNLCVDCGKPLTKNTAFCEHCGAEQAVILARQQWEKRQEEIRQLEETRFQEQSQEKTEDNTDLAPDIDITMNAEETGNTSLILILLIAGTLALVGVFFYKSRK